MKVLIEHRPHDKAFMAELCEAAVALFGRRYETNVLDFDGPVVELVCSCCNPGEANHPGAWIDMDEVTVVALEAFLRGVARKQAA